jgi:hypothetical protein
MFQEALGRLFDIGTCVVPVDINTSDTATGQRISMAGHSGIAIVLHTLVGGADDITIDVQQHTAYTGGTSADLDAAAVSTSSGIDHYYIKAETALDNDEAWVKVTQTAASEVVVVGATYGTQQKLVVVQVGADQLGDGYTHLSARIDCTTSTSQLLTALYIPYDLAAQRTPPNRPNLLRPGAANA